MKKTKLDYLLSVYSNIKCDKNSCKVCKNKKLCETVKEMIISIGGIK